MMLSNPRSLILVVGVSWLVASTVYAQDEEITGVVVGLGEVDSGPTTERAREHGGARWSSAQLHAATPEPPPPPLEALDGLERAYLEADFLRCLTLLQSPALDADRVLDTGQRAATGRLLVLSAACAHGAGDVGLARILLERVYVLELNPEAALRRTTPELQTIAEEERAAILGSPRPRVQLRSRPSGARVIVDGRLVCPTTPCSIEPPAGDHAIRLEHLGYAPRTERRVLDQPEELTLALDEASEAVGRDQLARALGDGADPGTADFMRTAALVYGARVVLLLWRGEGRSRAAIYDRALGRVVARTQLRGSAEVAAAAVLREWQGVALPTPLVRNPWFWAGTLGAAALVGVATWLAVRPRNEQHNLSFPHVEISDQVN